MPVYPERLTSRQEARGAVASQFWEQTVQSARTLDGQVQTLPCEPPPLTQCASSGLDRTQQLVAAQAVTTPVVPSFSAADGGMVLDRVMLRSGSESWWAAISARARAQNMWQQHRQGRKAGEVLRDLNNYRLAGRLRTAVGKRCSANLLFEVPNVNEFKEEVAQHGAVQALQSEGSQPLYKGQAVVKYHLLGHEIRAMATRNMDYLDSAATYCPVPLALSLDVSSNTRSDGIQYRAGLHQVTAPSQEASQGAVLGPAAGHAQLESSLHFQGAVAVEGEATLWKASAEHSAWRQSRRSVADPFGRDPTQELPGLAEGETHEEGQEQPAAAMPSSWTPETGPRQPVIEEPEDTQGASTNQADGGTARAHQWTSSSRKGDHLTRQADRSWRWQHEWHPGGGLRGGGTDPEASTSDSKQAVLHPWASQRQMQQSEQGVPMQLVPKAPHKRLHFVSAPSDMQGVLPVQGMHRWQPPATQPKSQLQEWQDMMGTGPVLEGIDVAEIQQGIAKARKAIDGARGSLGSMVKHVRGGVQSYRQAPPRAGAGRHSRTPYSPLLAEPFVKVNGAVGCLGRVPLPHQAFRLKYPLQHAAADTESLGNAPELAPSRFSQELWTPFLKDTALRVFASCALSAQAGRFAKRIGDYTAASMRLDLGLTSPDTPMLSLTGAQDTKSLPSKQQNGQPGERLLRHRAFALEGRGIWHAASISLAQQVWGPLRARVDTRLALDTTSQVRPESSGRLTFKSIAAGAPWLQPVVLETVWGLDLVIPGSQGSARACAWFSPTRQEGMVELRLF